MDVVEQEKQKRCFYCTKLNAYITAQACIDNQNNAEPYDRKSCCLNCKEGQVVKELVETARRYKWSIRRIGNCSGCNEFTLIHDSKRWLCSKCYHKLRKNKIQQEEVNMKQEEKNIIKLDFTEYQTLYEQLTKEAKEQFRTVEMQILFIINQFFCNKERVIQ